MSAVCTQPRPLTQRSRGLSLCATLLAVLVAGAPALAGTPYAKHAGPDAGRAFELFFHAWVVDPGAGFGFAASNALRAVAP